MKRANIEVTGTKKDLIEWIEGWQSWNSASIDPKAPILGVECDCGEKVEYQTKDDLPDKNVKCKCGEWLIKYEA